MTCASVAVIDYGMGNIRSVLNALEEVGASAELITEPEALRRFDKVVLPGVGAFQEAMDNLTSAGMSEALAAHIDAGKDLLGVCLGMQLLCLDSREDGLHDGLGWIRAHVVPFPNAADLKVPHMGWNSIEFGRDHPILDGTESGSDVYFVHSYYVDCEAAEDVVACTEYGVRFTSIVAHENVFGMQFHPEKSQTVGLDLMSNFVAS